VRTISAALKAFLAGDVRTTATLWLITRKDGQVFGFTDHDSDLLLNGQPYLSAVGYTASAIDSSSDLSTSNMEVDTLLDSSVILESDVEAGLWNSAWVTISLCNWANMSQGAVVLSSGRLGQFTLSLGQLKAELRSLAQIMQQSLGQLYSSTCRATLGDSRCKVDLGPLTASASVTSAVAGSLTFGAASLTQTGPAVAFTDTNGMKIPTRAPFTITPVPPTGGQWSSGIRVRGADGTTWTQVGGSPGSGQYQLSGGVYTFDGSDNPGDEVFIDYNYQIGFFAYGYVKFTSGQNAGYSVEVAGFSPGSVRTAMPLPYPIAVGDTFTIVAGCDRTLGTCVGRFNNIINFRGEPYIPGVDVITRSQSN
jgi:hypothetical protein